MICRLVSMIMFCYAHILLHTQIRLHIGAKHRPLAKSYSNVYLPHKYHWMIFPPDPMTITTTLFATQIRPQIHGFSLDYITATTKCSVYIAWCNLCGSGSRPGPDHPREHLPLYRFGCLLQHNSRPEFELAFNSVPTEYSDFGQWHCELWSFVHH